MKIIRQKNGIFHFYKSLLYLERYISLQIYSSSEEVRKQNYFWYTPMNRDIFDISWFHMIQKSQLIQPAFLSSFGDLLQNIYS